MGADSLCRTIKRDLGNLFSCTQQDAYHRIRTPFLYPDGDNIDLFCKYDGDVATITDLAETTGWLRMQTTALRRSPKQNQLIEDACLTHGVEFCSGMLQAQSRSEDELAEVVTRVAQAALRVSDLWFTFRTQTMQHIVDEVADFLTERDFQFERARKMPGRSGRSWTVDFEIRTSGRNTLVHVLTTGNRAAAHRATEHTLTQWHDLRHMAAAPESWVFVSLFNDTIDVWADEDYRLFDDTQARVLYWSRSHDFVDVLNGTE